MLGNIASMRIRNMQLEIAFHHKKMLAAGVWSVKTQTTQFLDKFLPRYVFDHVVEK